MSLLLCFDALSLSDWLFHYISMWFCVVTSNTWANTHTSPASRNSNMKNTWENLSYCCSHRNAHTHTHFAAEDDFAFFHILYEIFSGIFHSLTCSDCLHLFFHSPDHFVCIFHVVFLSHFTMACHLSICPENIEQFRAPGGLCVTSTHTRAQQSTDSKIKIYELISYF